MNSLPSRRWNPGFIALRWLHLFWGLPLLGLLVGLVMHFLPMIRGTATGIVQPTRELSDVTDRPPFEPADVAHALESDIVLHSTIGPGAGMVLAVVLAYLLELLFPRRSPTG